MILAKVIGGSSGQIFCALRRRSPSCIGVDPVTQSGRFWSRAVTLRADGALIAGDERDILPARIMASRGPRSHSTRAFSKGRRGESKQAVRWSIVNVWTLAFLGWASGGRVTRA